MYIVYVVMFCLTVIINPWHARAERVTVVGVSVCVCVCLLPRFLPPCTIRQPKSDTNGFSATQARFKKWQFS